MKTVAKESRLYTIYAYCDCGGELEYTGLALTVDPMIYEHKCPKCGNKYELLQIYPTTEVREINDN